MSTRPGAPVAGSHAGYVNYRAKVREWSNIQVAGRSYTVHSRLIGKEVQIRLYADWVEDFYQVHLVERMERVRGEGNPCCWKQADPSTTPRVRDLAEPKPPESLVLAMSCTPDRKIYDRLLMSSLTAAVGMCG